MYFNYKIYKKEKSPYQIYISYLAGREESPEISTGLARLMRTPFGGNTQNVSQTANLLYKDNG